MRLAALYGDDMASSSGRCGTVRLAGLLGLALLAALQSATAQNAAGSASPHVIPLFTPAGNIQQGFARIINHSHGAGTVRITGTDDAGRSRGPVTLFLDARETRHFNSEDLEEGNASKGLSGGLGDGVGNWRLRMESDLDLEVGAYIRTADGFLSSVHDVVRRAEIGGETVHHVPIFNPASNRNQVSKLRLVNLTRGRVNVRIRGRDDADRPAPGGEVELTLPAGGARQVSTQELEAGGAGFSGRLGDGEGKWQLFVSADGDIEVVSLMSTPTGHLTNLSVSGLGGGGTPEAVSPPAVGSVFRDCAGCPEMVGVPSGSYRMGSPADEVDRDADEGPVHRVTIGEPFAVGRYEVTFAQWDACHRAGGCSHRADDQGWGRGTRPVVDVSWHDAQEYVRWLSGETGRSYRLPSEAEWEYVARAGTTTRYWWGTTSATTGRTAMDAGALGTLDRRRRWARSRPTCSGSTTCTETCGSGSRTAATTVMWGRRATGAPGSRETAPGAGYAEARGSATRFRGICARRTGARTPPANGRSSAPHPTACGWRARSRRRCGTPSRCFAPRGRPSRALPGSSTARAGRERCTSGVPTMPGTGAARSASGSKRERPGTSTPTMWRRAMP